MKLIKISGIPAYYIGKADESILVVVEKIHPLEYPYEFGIELFRLAKKINKEKIPVYIDFSKIYGYKKVGKLIYLKDEDNIDVSSDEYVSFDELPNSVKSVIEKLHKDLFTTVRV